MIAYLLKSATCLALLLAFYYVVLEREKMHNFNRFYLLGSVFFSFLAPLYVIYIDATPIIFEAAEDTIVFSSADMSKTMIITEKSFDYIPILIGFYSMISIILLFRFGKNLCNIIQKTRNNSKIKYQKAVLVLVDDKILPYTFWNFIFINKREYKEKKIEQELFTHELTHVTQKHTADILILEFIQCLFWINPFIILLKKSVQLNHEFLADETVINEHKNIFQYQHLLLNKAAWNNKYYLASNLNYSLTKKRLKMMTTQSSRTKTWIKKLAVIPLLAGFIFLFAERVEAQKIINIIEEEIETINEQNIILETVEEQIFSNQGEKINTGFIDLNGKKHYFVTIDNSTKYYNRKGQLANKAGKVVSNLKTNASDVIPDNYIRKTYFNGKVFCEFFDDIPNNNKRKKEIKELEELVESLDNISMINYIKKYKDNDVLYYYNGKSIKHTKALNLINNNRPIDMLTRYVDGKMVINLNKENQKKNIQIHPLKLTRKYLKK
ncbi:MULTISPECIES: M56 family metallopeptidase [unclassified Polaribacter]|uniref:M56 family metallopeptidase n=1 Tax=unclassified Polaribacter TaxID=196858 RepID=UPI0011BDFA69|nr:MULTISPECIES: M56 family metallopeptidase [unclassified Polaribacter]TXD51003.1 M56 family metallopeptidase [Polaribacter sp. IC063]TXD57973.1 M56 family metallopeptidase [Polaribacter sp. IC066]